MCLITNILLITCTIKQSLVTPIIICYLTFLVHWMHASSKFNGFFLRIGDHFEWGVAGRFSLSSGEWTTFVEPRGGTWCACTFVGGEAINTCTCSYMSLHVHAHVCIHERSKRSNPGLTNSSLLLLPSVNN